MRSPSSVSRCSAAAVLLLSQVGLFAAPAHAAAVGRADAPTASTATPGANISGTWIRDPDHAPPAATEPPLKEPYAKAYKAPHKPPTPSRATPGEKCKVEGMPTIMAAHDALEILQTPGQVTVLAEYMNQTRRIYLDEPLPSLDDVNPGYMGYSVGKWHGNTLAVQTLGVRDDVRYLEIPHSAKMHISENIHLAAPDRLQDDVTIVDPDVLTRPYQLNFSYKRDPQHRIMEYPCAHKGIAADEPPLPGKPPQSK